MDLVLGLSMTSRDIRWVLVEGTTGEGAPVDCGALDIPDVAAFDAESFLEELLGDGVVHSVGLTCAQGAEALLAKIRDAFGVVGGGARLVEVSDVDATKVLASGIQDITGNNFVVVIVAEPEAAIVAAVNAQRVTVERIDRPGFGPRINAVSAAVDSVRPRPDSIFVLGSGDAETLASIVRDETARPVITADEAEFALTRGAALVSARAGTGAASSDNPRFSQVRVLSSVLAAAVVVFVVSVSLALGLRLTPNSIEQPRNASAEGHAESKPAPKSAPIAEAAAHPPVLAPPAAPPPAPEAVPVPEVAPAPEPEVAPMPEPAPEVAPAEPAYVPPAPEPVAPAPEYVPPVPDPVYVPPAPPAYVPPVAPPQPRLRDRIIEKIPLLNRFH